MMKVAIEWHIIGSAPKITRLPGERPRDRVVTHEEELLYLAAAPQLLRDIATIIIDMGLRPEEAFRLRWEHVHLDAKQVHIPNGKTAYARRDVPMTTRVKALLGMRYEAQKKPKEGWLFPASTKSGRVKSVKTQHRKALKDSKVKPFVLYSFRHTMLTRLGSAGANAFDIQQVAGHTSALISQRYVHPPAESIKLAFGRLEVYNANATQLATESIQ